MSATEHIPEISQIDPIAIPSETPLTLAYLPGRSDRLVVALAGVGTVRKEPPPFEMIGTASNKGEDHVLLVADPLRCWMNHPDYAAELVAQIEATKEVLGIKTVITLGNSMGAFMAIRLAELTKVDTVIALAPQFSAHQDVIPEETRWKAYRNSIKDWHVLDVGAMAAPGTTYFVFHGDNAKEALHWQRFPATRYMHHFILEHAGHNLAVDLKKRNVLPRIINAAMHNRPRAVRKVLQRRKAPRFKPFYRSQYEALQSADPTPASAAA